MGRDVELNRMGQKHDRLRAIRSTGTWWGEAKASTIRNAAIHDTTTDA